ALAWLGFLNAEEAQPGWRDWFEELARDKRVARLSANSPSPPLGAERDGVRWGEPRAADDGATHLTLPALRAGPLPLPPQAGGEGQRLPPLWIAAERVPHFRALWPGAAIDPAISAPASYSLREWSREEALIEILRGRLEGLGPVTEAALAAPLGIEPRETSAALAALETEGFAMRGRFTPGAETEEWCERRLLARIHRYTVGRLRAEIQPVAARDFLRFLLGWQRVTAETRMEGPDALEVLVRQLEGFEAAARAWETEILPARLESYEPSWLDDQCLAGRIAWARLRPRNGGDRSASPVRTTPIALLARRHTALWASLSALEEPARPTSRAQAVADFIRQYGASFFDELVEGTGLLRPQVEEALGELVALGMVTSDSFAGLRALLRKPASGGRRRTTMFGMESAGRWALARRIQPQTQARPEAVEHLARTLLLRYGVVFWRLIEREAPWLPPWRDLVRVYRRLEARGEIRGGRFVAGFSGEQFALAEAVGMLREVRRKPSSGSWVSLSGADPLNLVGILTPGPRLAALTGNRLLYRDGLPVALFAGGEAQFLETFDPATQWEARKALLRGAVPSSLVALS
ncbi:MAG TPA: hypothetical protein VHY78_05985, partial [Stellaceae bacterium]|nr:hypothetical protein [Stellaceae bacterium]